MQWHKSLPSSRWFLNILSIIFCGFQTDGDAQQSLWWKDDQLLRKIDKTSGLTPIYDNVASFMWDKGLSWKWLLVFLRLVGLWVNEWVVVWVGGWYTDDDQERFCTLRLFYLLVLQDRKSGDLVNCRKQFWIISQKTLWHDVTLRQDNTREIPTSPVHWYSM